MALRILMCVPEAASVGGLFHFNPATVAIGTKRTIQLRPCLSAIGLTTDKRRPGGRTAWQRLTHIDSGVCVAAVEVRGEILVYRGHRSRMRPAVRVVAQREGRPQPPLAGRYCFEIGVRDPVLVPLPSM